MRTFRILVALAVAAGTFYSLNALAVQYGYRDRLDLKTGITMGIVITGNTASVASAIIACQWPILSSRQIVQII